MGLYHDDLWLERFSKNQVAELEGSIETLIQKTNEINLALYKIGNLQDKIIDICNEYDLDSDDYIIKISDDL